MLQEKRDRIRKAITILTLIIVGENVFLLPFVLARIFRPTFLDVFELTNLELGGAFSLYGIIAAGSYFVGGPLADRFSARRLMTIALVLTALGGIIFAGVPDLGVLTILYGFWGCTTILLFWAALIRATREWGGESGQGLAYGLLDSGRGLFAALLGSVSVALFALFLPVDIEVASLEDRKTALRAIIWIFTGLVMGSALLAWFVIPETSSNTDKPQKEKLTGEGLKIVLKMPTVWLQAIIVVCAYVGYKCTDDFSLFARDAFGYNDIEAATIGTVSFWIRPFAALGAGLLGDRIRASRALMMGFLLLIIGSLFIASGILQPGMSTMLILSVAITSVAIYALRGLYFAIFEEAKVPLAFTGSAIGLVSIIGFTPDIFMGPLMGYLLDRSPGALGHQHVFAVLAIFSVIGLIASFVFFRLININSDTSDKKPA